MFSADAVPSSPASLRFELASPASGGPVAGLPTFHERDGGEEEEQDEARRAGQQQDAPPPHNPQSSTAPSNNTVSLPTAPGQAVNLAIHSALTHNPDESSATQKADSERTADLKRHTAGADVKQTTLDSQHDVQTAEAGKAIDAEYALAAIPSLEDYIRYVELLQANWRDAPVVDIVYNKLSYVVKVSPEETRVPSISRSFLDFFRWVTFQLPKPVPLAVFQSDTHADTAQRCTVARPSLCHGEVATLSNDVELGTPPASSFSAFGLCCGVCASTETAPA